MRFERWFRFILLAAAAAVLLTLMAACEEEEEEAPTGTPTGAETGTPTSAAEVPELADGVLQVGSDIAYAPMEFFEEGTTTPLGLSIDLGDALAEEMGARAEFINSGFDGLVGALDVERFDVIISSMTITEKRSKEIDFVPYFNAGTDILVPSGNPNNIAGIEDLSGLTAAVQVGTIQVDQLNAANEDFRAAGEAEVDILTFDLNPLAVEQLNLGRADAVLADSPVVANDARLSEGELEALGLAIETAPYGIGIRKTSTELKAAIEDALQKIMEDGTYDDILEKWGLESGAIQ
jgi:polar amino acid transport system substrate-binding protein